MGTLVPSQMFDHNIDVVKGPSLMHRLDFHAAPVAGEAINEGSVMSLNPDGKFIAGCPAGGVAAVQPMPIFAMQGINDFDANSDVGNISGGVMSGYVATGGFEIATTEFDAGGTYLPNTLLTAFEGGAAGTEGFLTDATGSAYKLETICGVVSKAAAVNADGKSMLSFWSCYLPSATAV